MKNTRSSGRGWIYLVATHLGTAFLFAMFVLLGSRCGSFDFGDFDGLGGVADVVFVLAVVGFGAKAGFFGLHVWLPEAHPARRERTESMSIRSCSGSGRGSPRRSF